MLKDRNYSKLIADAMSCGFVAIQPRTGRRPADDVYLVPIKVATIELGEDVDASDSEICEIVGLLNADAVFAFAQVNAGFFDVPGVSYVLVVYLEYDVIRVEICKCVESYKHANNISYKHYNYMHFNGMRVWFDGSSYCGPLYL